MTTIHERSFAGLALAHLVVMFSVCGGLLFLLPIAGFSNAVPTIAVPALDCAAPADRAGDHQVSGDAAGLDVPDSCDDDDDDVPLGSDAAIAVDECPTRIHDDAQHVFDVNTDLWISRAVEGYSLRGPPDDNDRSPDADDDFDGGDDDPAAESSVLVLPATNHGTCFLTTAEFLSASSTRSSDLSLRAPPL